jgi:Domain of unknown function (DUF2382)
MDTSKIKHMPEYLETEILVDNAISDNSTEIGINTQTVKSQTITENIENIRLLEERLAVDNSKYKVGEVIIRKKIETRMVQVPVRSEKLIVEQVSPEHKQLAEIDLSQEEIPSIELTQSAGESLGTTHWNSNLTVSGCFSSPKIASLLLNAIALEHNHGCQQVKLSILVKDHEQQQKYQEWFDRCSQGQLPKPPR